MKKFFSMMMIAAAAISFAACGEEGPTDEPGNKPTPEGAKLETPVPEVAEVGDTYFVISWNAIENADSYTVNLDGDNYSTTECTFKFENLNAGDYTPRVKAVGEGYKDSDFGKVNVTLTGATSANWFEVSIELAELNEAKGYGPYNAAVVTMKGTDVANIAYNFYPAASLEGVTDDVIKDALAVDTEIVADINSDKGYSALFGPFAGDTTYALCILVTNKQDVEYFTIEKFKTEAAEPSAAALAWVGTWEVKSTQKYSLDDTATGTIIAGEDTFTVNITTSPNDPNEVVIDGWSVLGLGGLYVTYGSVDGDDLYILNGTYLGDGQAKDGSVFYYYWVGWFSIDGGDVDFLTQAYPSNVVTMNGDKATSTNKYNLYYNDGTPAPTVCYCSDVFGVGASGGLYFLIEAFPGVYRTGDMTWTKSAAAQTTSVDVMNFNPTALKSSVVLR